MNSRRNFVGMSLLVAVTVASCAPAASTPSTATPAPGGNAPAANAQGSSGPRTVNSGVYTVAQANRGQQTFQANCTMCHTTADFTGSNFQQAWSGRPLADLHELISTTMPQTAPGSLTPQQYSDVLSYMLRLNNYPTGATELPTTDQALTSIQMVPQGR